MKACLILSTFLALVVLVHSSAELTSSLPSTPHDDLLAPLLRQKNLVGEDENNKNGNKKKRSLSDQGIHRQLLNIKASYAHLAKQLPFHTAIYQSWPRDNLRVNLPDYIQTATSDNRPKIKSNQQNDQNTDSFSDSDNFLDQFPLMGKPIHVIQGNRLELNLINSIQTTGLSIHFHGFEMRDALEYDGVVGITQCAVSPDQSFLYNFTINESPGTYWYHTHSGSIGIDAYNAVKGPLIVHSRDVLLDVQNNSTHNMDLAKVIQDDYEGAFNDDSKDFDFGSLLSYDNERILFFSDGSLMSDAHTTLFNMGSLNPPVSKNDDGFTVGTTLYDFGTCNGKLREVVNVEPGKTYKFRLLNGGHHYAFRVVIDSIPMRVIAADSEPVKPYDVDEVILHAAERFDVEITVPSTFVGGERLWIRADTLESSIQGYQVRHYYCEITSF